MPSWRGEKLERSYKGRKQVSANSKSLTSLPPRSFQDDKWEMEDIRKGSSLQEIQTK